VQDLSYMQLYNRSNPLDRVEFTSLQSDE